LSLNIAGAYPADAGIGKWQRTCRLCRGVEALIEIVDDFVLSQAADVTMSLLTACKPEIDGRLIIRDPDGTGVQVEYDSDCLVADVEALEIYDEKLTAAWGTGIYRVTLRATEPVSRGACKWLSECFERVPPPSPCTTIFAILTLKQSPRSGSKSVEGAAHGNMCGEVLAFGESRSPNAGV